MTVLAKGTFRNWKERYLVLRTHHMAYYEDERNLHKAEAEFQINPTVSVKNFDHKGAFGLKISSAQDALSIALPTDDERTTFVSYVRDKPDDRSTWGDVLWAIVNSAEFTMNH